MRDDGHGDGTNEPQRHKAVRQDSYLAAVRTPVTAGEVPGISRDEMHVQLHALACSILSL
jgi:hypothetical protein